MTGGVEEILKQLAKINELKSIADAVVTKGGPDISRKADFACNKWTIYKLVAHMLYVPLYTSIISKRFREFYYIDLFAGSGLNYYEDDSSSRTRTVIRIAGSPLIALAYAVKPFTHAYLNDREGVKVKLLMQRIEALRKLHQEARQAYSFPASSFNENTIKYFSNDANIIVSSIVSEIESKHEKLLRECGKGCHMYFFIDPEGLDFRRSSLERIVNSRVRNDVIILFNSYGAAMQVSNYIRGLASDDRALRECLGKDYYDYILKRATNLRKSEKELKLEELMEILRDYYTEIFTRSKNQYVTEVIPLTLFSENRVFDLIYATRKTESGNRYINVIRYIKTLTLKASKDNYQIVDMFMDYIRTGKMPGLLQYFIEDPERVLRDYETLRRYGK